MTQKHFISFPLIHAIHFHIPLPSSGHYPAHKMVSWFQNIQLLSVDTACRTVTTMNTSLSLHPTADAIYQKKLALPKREPKHQLIIQKCKVALVFLTFPDKWQQPHKQGKKGHSTTWTEAEKYVCSLITYKWSCCNFLKREGKLCHKTAVVKVTIAYWKMDSFISCNLWKDQHL